MSSLILPRTHEQDLDGLKASLEEVAVSESRYLPAASVAKQDKKAEKKAAYEKAKAERVRGEEAKPQSSSSPKTVTTTVEAYTEPDTIPTSESGISLHQWTASRV